MSPKETLAQLISEIFGGIINDCLTFTKIRLHHNPVYKSLETGGGNFLMTLGLLSTLGFMAKIYAHLSNPSSFFDSNKHDEVKKLKFEIIKRPGINKKLLDYLKIPPMGSVNEEDAFVNLVNRVQSDNIVYLGLDVRSSRKIWKIYRNKLAHLTIPLSPVGVYDKDMSHLTWGVVEHEISKLGSFLAKDDLILCNPDKLIQDAKTIGTWLCSYIDSRNEETATNTLKWLKSELA
ncbi:MAG: hypothetical protein AAB453_04170 [Patescibacteria group bacterium]